MTVQTLQAGMPPLSLAPGMVLKLEAVNTTTGAAVAGASATAWQIFGSSIGSGDDGLPDDTPGWVWGDDGG